MGAQGGRLRRARGPGARREPARALRGGRLRAYRPQRDFLTLLNLGGGEALAAKWGVALRGRGAFRLKDWIDRRFVRRFRVLDGDGAPARRLPRAAGDGRRRWSAAAAPRRSAAPALERALARLPKAPVDASVQIGLAEPDDAALVALPRGDRLLATIDAFRAFTDDPWWVGRVAAVNAVSDVFAKGGRARHALALVNVPEAEPRRGEETLYQVLAGVRAALDPLGVSLVGGHSTQGGALYVGLTVTGDLEGEPLRASGLAAGQCLILSKPLGSGVLLAADMRVCCPGAQLAPLLEGLARTNADAARMARAAGATGCTDVSGFGLAGHLGGARARERRVGACVRARAAGVARRTRAARARRAQHLPRAERAAARRDRDRRGRRADDRELLFDPQTSGGLLFGVAPQRAAEAVAALRAAGDRAAAVIGASRRARSDGIAFEVVAGDEARILTSDARVPYPIPWP